MMARKRFLQTATAASGAAGAETTLGPVIPLDKVRKIWHIWTRSQGAGALVTLGVGSALAVGNWTRAVLPMGVPATETRHFPHSSEDTPLLVIRPTTSLAPAITDNWLKLQHSAAIITDVTIEYSDEDE